MNPNTQRGYKKMPDVLYTFSYQCLGKQKNLTDGDDCHGCIIAIKGDKDKVFTPNTCCYSHGPCNLIWVLKSITKSF